MTMTVYLTELRAHSRHLPTLPLECGTAESQEARLAFMWVLNTHTQVMRLEHKFLTELSHWLQVLVL